MLKKKIKQKSTHFLEKIKIRIDAIKNVQELKVLDLYHGDGIIWKTIQEKTNKKINVLGVEKKSSKSIFKVIKGDNIKVVTKLNISEYNVIDLDSYSNPLDLLDYCFPLAKNGTIFFYTLIVNPLNGGPKQLNVVDNQHKICRSIGNKFISEQWDAYLNKLGVKQYKQYMFKDSAMIKRYGCFVK